MLDKELVKLINNEFPNVKIVSEREIAIPIAQLKVSCYFNHEEKLPSIIDAVIRMYQIEKDEDKISNNLGIETNLVIAIISRLSSEGYIDYFNDSITDKGRNYINSQKISSLKKGNINILVNKITGELIYKDSNQFSSAKDIRKQSIFVPFIENSAIDVEEKVNLKNVVDIYERRNEIETNLFNTEEKKLVEILKVAGNKTVYLKVKSILILDTNNQLRTLVYDKSSRNEKIEEFINNTEHKEKRLYTSLTDMYTVDNIFQNIQRNTSFENISDYPISDENEVTLISSAKVNIIFILPMLECDNISNELLATIEEKVNNSKLPINIFISGTGYPLESQSRQIYRLTKLAKEFEHFNIYSLNDFIPRTLICDDYKYLMKEYIACEIPSNLSQKEYLVTRENLYLNEREAFEKYTEIVDCSKQRFNDINIYSQLEISNLLKEIFKKIDTLDEILDEKGLGWTSESMPHLYDKNLILDSKVCTDSESFKTFVFNISKTFVEQFKKKSEQFKRKYFENEFEKQYPELYKSLNRIRVYRNYFGHTELNKHFKNYYYEYSRQDFNSYFPYVLEDCFQYLQKLLLTELLDSLQKTIDIERTQ